MLPRPLAELAAVRTGYTVRGPADRLPAGPYALVQARDVEADGRLAPERLPRVALTGRPGALVLRPGDVLVAARAPYPVALVEAPPPGTVPSSQFYLVRPDPARVEPAYLGWFLATAAARRALAAREQGTTLRLISKAVLGALPVPLPPPAEQVCLAHVGALVRREADLLRRRLALARARADALERRLLS